jgi:hypothetical protein
MSTAARHVRAFAFAVALLGGTLAAEPITRELGENLVYQRVTSVPSDLPKIEMLRDRPCVLDARFARGDETAAKVLGAWIDGHSAPRKPLLVLANASTSPELLSAIRARRDGHPVVVIGIPHGGFHPDIEVVQSPADEKAAFDALAAGASTSALTTDNPNKPRNDEASLSHERPAPQPDETAATESEQPAEQKAATPTIDASLQRAIQLHRGLRALKKID